MRYETLKSHRCVRSRWVVRAATGACFLAIIGIACLWTRSYNHQVILSYGAKDALHWLQVFTEPGGIDLQIFGNRDPSDNWRRRGYIHEDEDPFGSTGWKITDTYDFPESAEFIDQIAMPRHYGFRYGRGANLIKWPMSGLNVLQTDTLLLITIPFWLPTVGFSVVLATRGVVLLRRHKSRVAGLCQFCGYDVRATPDRCPECGQVPELLKDRERSKA